MADVVMIVSDGYSLKKYRLKKWIYDNDHTQPYVAKVLGLSPDVFKRKLREHDKFNREQIKSLVYLMGARAAFEVLYFPSNRRRKKVWWHVFGKYKKGVNRVRENLLYGINIGRRING